MQNLNPDKATQQYIPIKILKEISEICSYILYRSFNNSLFRKVFLNNLKKLILHPSTKKTKRFWKIMKDLLV